MSASDPVPASGPGQEYNAGPVTEPRQAASVILLRGGGEALELLLVRRTPAARFMGGVWVFPGGAVDVREGQGDDAHRAAAVRELREEAGITLEDPQALGQAQRGLVREPAEHHVGHTRKLLARCRIELRVAVAVDRAPPRGHAVDQLAPIAETQARAARALHRQ